MSEKRKNLIEKAQRISRGVEPTFIRPTHYMADLIRALNYYNINNTDLDKKKWFIGFIAQTDKRTAASLLKLDERKFRHAGILARLKLNGSELQTKEQEKLDSMSRELIGSLTAIPQPKVKSSVSLTTTPPIVNVQERIEALAHAHASEFDSAIDDFCLNKSSEFSAKNYLLSNNISIPVAKSIAKLYIPLRQELSEAVLGDDRQLTEGYRNFNKRQLKAFLAFVTKILEDCMQQVVTGKATRAITKKPQSPTKMVAKLKYMKEFKDLDLKSIPIARIVDSTEVWVYNTKLRKIQVYRSTKGSRLSVKNSTILGFDIKLSTQYTIRTPETYFSFNVTSKRELSDSLLGLKTKASVPNGRTSEDCVIIGAF
jgi:hypothetical protein